MNSGLQWTSVMLLQNSRQMQFQNSQNARQMLLQNSNSICGWSLSLLQNGVSVLSSSFYKNGRTENGVYVNSVTISSILVTNINSRASKIQPQFSRLGAVFFRDCPALLCASRVKKFPWLSGFLRSICLEKEKKIK